MLCCCAQQNTFKPRGFSDLMPHPTIFASYLLILGSYSAAMIMFGRWLTLSGLVIEEVEDEPSECLPEAPQGDLRDKPLDRWMTGSDGVTQVPRISRVHIIPLEDLVPDDSHAYLHCATMECWCNPRLDPEDSSIVIHNAMTEALKGWVNIGENLGE